MISTPVCAAYHGDYSRHAPARSVPTRAKSTALWSQDSLRASTIFARVARPHKQVKHAASFERMAAEQDNCISEVVKRESRGFGASSAVASATPATRGHPQDVFYELVESESDDDAYRPITGAVQRLANIIAVSPPT
jgi:hypothetical protein